MAATLRLVPCRLAALVALVALAPSAAAEPPSPTTLAVGVHVDSDGHDNPSTNELTYPGLDATFARQVSPGLRWHLAASLGSILGAETDGLHAGLGVGASYRSAGRRFVGLRGDLAWSYNRSDNVGTVCGSHGVLGRLGAELGLRLGRGRALVASAGVRGRQILGYQCTGGDWASDRALNRGPAVALAFEWSP